MYEVEVKAKARKGTGKKIRDIARAAGAESQEDTYFTHPCRDFAETDEALRIRSAKGKLTLTYKGAKLDAQTKSRREIETEASPELFGILENLGFKKLMKVRKVRSYYRLGKTTISIDEVSGLGTFFEIEQKAKTIREYGVAKQEVLSLLKTLGCSPSDSMTKSYLELLLEKRKH